MKKTRPTRFIIKANRIDSFTNLIALEFGQKITDFFFKLCQMNFPNFYILQNK